jgi:hypothetical protein
MAKQERKGRQKLKPQELGPDSYRQLLITTITGTEKPTQAPL